MSFVYENFKRVGFDHSGAPACFSYVTNDAINIVTSQGYFSDPRATIAPGDCLFVYANGRPFTIFATSDSTAMVGDERRKVIESPDDLPSPIDGVHYLVDNYTYDFTAEVDLEGFRIVGGRNTVIHGESSENCRIKSTGLAQGTALISSEWSMPIRHITLEAATILDLDADGNSDQALDWYGVNFSGSTDIGRIANYSNFIGQSLAFLGVCGLEFDGTFGTVAMTGSLFSGTSTTPIISLPSTAIISRRFRIDYSSVIVPASGVGIDVSTSASIPVEGYILDTVNFSGDGAYTQGVLFSDNKSRWVECRGVRNSAAIGGYYMQGNATATTISFAETPVKAAGTTSPISVSQKFSYSLSNRATSTSAINRDFKVTAVFTATSGSGNQVGIYIAKNGSVLEESETYITANAAGRLENGAVQVVTDLSSGDYIELWVENNTAANNITIEDLNLLVEPID